MERPICPLCPHWISEWQELTGKTIMVNKDTNHEKTFHLSCVMAKGLTITQLEEWHKRELHENLPHG